MKKTAILLAVFAASCSNNSTKENPPTVDSSNVQLSAPIFSDSVIVYKYEGDMPKMDTAYIKNATEPLKAIIGYYSYQFNTACKDTKHCQLTSALGFEQDSPQHKSLVQKWFKDEDTKNSIANGGNAKPDGEDSYSWLSSLSFFVNGKDVKVKYTSSWISKDIHGKGQGDDTYRMEENEVKVINRNHTELDVQ